MRASTKWTISWVVKYIALAPSDGRKPAIHSETTTTVPNSNPAFSEDTGIVTGVA
jgi:hypothetical protein